MASAEARCTRYADEQMPYEIEAVVTGALKGIFGLQRLQDNRDITGMIPV